MQCLTNSENFHKNRLRDTTLWALYFQFRKIYSFWISALKDPCIDVTLTLTLTFIISDSQRLD